MNSKFGIVIFLITVALRVLAFGALSEVAESRGVMDRYPVIGGDSGGYVGVAQVLLKDGTFASPGASEPQSYVLPAYPVFLAGVIALTDNLRYAVLLQAIVAGFSSVLLWKIGSMVSLRVGTGAALLFAMDPIGIFYSTTILTETLFIFLLLSSVYVYAKFFDGSVSTIFLSGVILGITTLARPTALVVLPVFMLGMWIYSARRARWVTARMLVICFGFSLVVFPWMLRNKLLFDSWSLTAVAGTQWFQQSAPLYYAYKHSISHAEAYEVFQKRLLEINPHKSDAGTLRNTPYMGQVVREFLFEDPFGYAYFHAVKSLPFFFSDGLRDIARRMGYVAEEQSNIGNLLLARDARGIYDAFAHNGLSSALMLIGGSAWVVITAGMIVSVGGFHLSSLARPNIIVLCLLIIAVTVLIAGGPNANARYRFSVSPFIFIAAVHGFLVLRTYFMSQETDRI